MPIYNMRCSICGWEGEVLVSRRELQYKCEVCGGVLVKLNTPLRTNTIFKGEGWSKKEGK